MRKRRLQDVEGLLRDRQRACVVTLLVVEQREVIEAQSDIRMAFTEGALRELHRTFKERRRLLVVPHHTMQLGEIVERGDRHRVRFAKQGPRELVGERRDRDGFVEALLAVKLGRLAVETIDLVLVDLLRSELHQ